MCVLLIDGKEPSKTRFYTAKRDGHGDEFCLQLVVLRQGNAIGFGDPFLLLMRNEHVCVSLSARSLSVAGRRCASITS
jgi:hypothetical protein